LSDQAKAFSETESNRERVNTIFGEKSRTETIAWGFRQIYEFRDIFKAAGLLTDGVEHDLIQLQDQLVWLLVDTDDPLGER
jgi:hypothetical protein